MALRERPSDDRGSGGSRERDRGRGDADVRDRGASSRDEPRDGGRGREEDRGQERGRGDDRGRNSDRDRGNASSADAERERHRGRDDDRNVGGGDRDRGRGDERQDRGDRGGGRDERGRGPSSGKARPVYQRRTAEDVEKRATQKGALFDSVVDSKYKIFRAKEGDHLVRFLPRYDNNAHFGMDIFIHRDIGPDNNVYLCPNKMSGKPCPVCELRNRMEREGADKDEIKSLRVQQQVLCFIIDRDDEKAGPQVWTMPWTFDRDVGKVSTNKRTGELLLIDDPDNGYDVEWSRTGKDVQTKYTVLRIARDATPILKDSRDQESLVDFLSDNPLPKVLQYFDTDYIEKVLYGEMGTRDKDLDGPRDRERGEDRGGDRGGDDRGRNSDGGREREDDRGRERNEDRGGGRGRGDDRGQERDGRGARGSMDEGRGREEDDEIPFDDRRGGDAGSRDTEREPERQEEGSREERGRSVSREERDERAQEKEKPKRGGARSRTREVSDSAKDSLKGAKDKAARKR